MKSKNAYALFSDGACRGNPGPGAWGMVGQNAKGEVLFKGSGVETTTTNNRMEMMGAIEAMKYLLSEGVNTDSAEVYLYSDSKYVVDGLKSWMQGWKNRGWKKADKKTPENVDLWQELDRISSSFSNIQYLWVKGHAGHPQNELCDQLANEALDDSGF
ncbi:MAG: ribonuclease HI [Halobacteriovorax sp. JY17]|nr:MAG: ribonuclease HI [Halobacteriovorax sp. JY17]